MNFFKKIKNKIKDLKTPTFIILFFVFFILSNWLFSVVSYRLDLSYGKSYTLSENTKKILKNIKKPLEINLYISSDLPLQLLPLKNEVVDLVNEYKRYGSNVEVKILDPKKDEQAGKDVKTYGIPELPFTQLNNDQYAVSSVYFGALISFNGKKEPIIQLSNLSTLEFDITSLIYKLTNANIPKVAFYGLENSFSTSGEDAFANLKAIIKNQFELSSVTGDKITELNKDVKSLVILANETDFSTNEANIMQNYLDNGGKIILFINGVNVFDTTLETNISENNLYSLLEKNGIILNKNLLLSSSSQLVSFGGGSVNFYSRYPFWVKTSNLNYENQMLSNISSLNFPWVSSFDLVSKKDINSIVLAKTDGTSWDQKENFTLIPDTIKTPDAKNVKQFNLIVESENKNKGKILAIGSTRFIKDQYLSNSSNNLEFFLNALNIYASNGALSGIRSRDTAIFPIKEYDNQTKDIIKYLNILLLPGLILLFGAIKSLRRK